MSRFDRGHHGQRGSGKAQRAMNVQQALEWAFGIEKVRLELPERQDRDRPHRATFGMEYVLIQRARLGCQIDGGRHKISSYTHPDAEVIAATLAGLPDDLGGIRMAIRVTELARAGLTPDWMPGAVPRCVPLDTRRNRHGERAVSVVVGTEPAFIGGKWRSVEVRACPVTFRPDPHQIDAARRDYDAWWHALGWVRDGLVRCDMLREITVTQVMPKVRPWEKSSVAKGINGGRRPF